MVKRGEFITFEGGEGSGKTTQLHLLCNGLTKRAIPFLSLREPGGTQIGELVRTIVLDPSIASMDAMAEIFLYEAARAQIMEEKIEPGLTAGTHVFCDRFYDSTTAYQGFARGQSVEDIRTLNKIVTRGVQPDLTLYLDIDPVEGLHRATKEGADRIESEAIEFHQKVRAGFLWIAEQEPERVKVIDASGTIAEVFIRIMSVLTDEGVRLWT